MLAGEQRGVADEQRGIGMGQHGERVGSLFQEFGAGGVEVLKEDACVGDGAERGSVGGDGADLRERGVIGQLLGIFHQQQDAAHLAARGNRAAGHDGELRRERGDGNQTEVGGAGGELCGAGGGLGVMDFVVLAKLRGAGPVLEVVEAG